MNLEFLIYIVLFVLTIGVVAAAILLTYNMHKTYEKNILQTLLYQQIFLYSFFLNGIWGKIILNEILSDFNFSHGIIQKISQFILILGMPFLIMSWYMLIKFFIELKGYTLKKWITLAYFILFTFTIIIGTTIIKNQDINSNNLFPDIFIRIINCINLIIHLFLLTFILIITTKKSDRNLDISFKLLFIYFTGVLIYSLGIWFTPFFNSKINALIILLLFVFSALIPLLISFSVSKLPKLPEAGQPSEFDFEGFCRKYEISKREAEIILEICAGKSNQEIADRLFITLQTVKDHTHRIYTKTGINNRVMLANLARGNKANDLK